MLGATGGLNWPRRLAFIAPIGHTNCDSPIRSILDRRTDSSPDRYCYRGVACNLLGLIASVLGGGSLWMAVRKGGPFDFRP
jgi:hypothetical protein